MGSPVRLCDELLLLRSNVFIAHIATPQILRGRELFKSEFSFRSALHVMLKEAVAVGAVNKRYIQHLGILDALLHTSANAVLVVLCLDNCQGQIWLVVQQIVSAFPLATGSNIPSDDNATVREVILHSDLFLPVPPGILNGRGNKLKFDVLFSHFVFLHQIAHAVPPLLLLIIKSYRKLLG